MIFVACLIGINFLALMNYYSPNMRLMADSWHEEMNARLKKDRADVRKKRILSERRFSKLKIELFRDISLFVEEDLKMSSSLDDFKVTVLRNKDVNVAWKYNELVKSYLGSSLGATHTQSLDDCTERYLIKFD
jgi:hypothetical protein